MMMMMMMKQIVKIERVISIFLLSSLSYLSRSNGGKIRLSFIRRVILEDLLR